MRVLSGHQPLYLPWLGVFHKYATCDVFVYMNTVKFSRKDYIHRNKILSVNGVINLSTELVGSKSVDSQAINEVMLSAPTDSKESWRQRHFQSIRHSYLKAPYFAKYVDQIEHLIRFDKSEFLWQLNYKFFTYMLNEIKLGTNKIILMSEMNSLGAKDMLVLNQALQLGCDHVLFGAFGRDYVAVDKFNAAGVTVEFQDFKHPVYPQVNYRGEFIPSMSCIDLLFNVGHDNFLNILLNQGVRVK